MYASSHLTSTHCIRRESYGVLQRPSAPPGARCSPWLASRLASRAWQAKFSQLLLAPVLPKEAGDLVRYRIDVMVDVLADRVSKASGLSEWSDVGPLAISRVLRKLGPGSRDLGPWLVSTYYLPCSSK